MLLILLAFLVIVYVIYSCFFKNEGFGRISGKWCEDCGKKSFGQCMDCFNCGFCMTDKNKGYCTKGTVFGPNNKSDRCQRWIHNDDYVSNLHRSNTCNTIA